MQLYSSMAILKLNPKELVFFSALFISFFPQNKHRLMAAERCNTQEHESINNFREYKYRIELNVSFLSLKDEEVIKWGENLFFSPLALVCSPFKFDRKIRGHCFCFL